MRKKISLLLVFVFILTAFNSFAAQSVKKMTKEEAVVSIEKALEDPEISQWVQENYGNPKLFFKAVKASSEGQAVEVAKAFNDFQEHGGEIKFTDNELKWILVGFCFILLLILI